MSDTKKPEDEAPAPTGTFVAILAAVAVTGGMWVLGSPSDSGSSDANATTAAPLAPDQIVSPEEHSQFIREGHDRAARDGDAAPLPATF